MCCYVSINEALTPIHETHADSRYFDTTHIIKLIFKFTVKNAFIIYVINKVDNTITLIM